MTDVRTLDAQQALEAMRNFLQEYWLRDRDLMASDALGDVQAVLANQIGRPQVWRSWLDAISQEPLARAGEIPRMEGMGVRLEPRQALDATRVYLEDFCARADSELAMVLSWTEIMPDGDTSDPASWWDWIDAVLTVLVVRQV